MHLFDFVVQFTTILSKTSLFKIIGLYKQYFLYNKMISNFYKQLEKRLFKSVSSPFLSFSNSSYAFSKRKGIQQNIKSKKINSNQSIQSNITQNSLIQLSNMKILFTQFFPPFLLLTPTFLFIQQVFDPTFFMGITMAQKYLSAALLINLDFQTNKTKTMLFISSIALLNSLTGVYSFGTSLGMILLTIIAPLKYSNQKQRYSQRQIQRIKTMTSIRIGYFFMFIFLSILKGYYFESTYGIEKRLNELNKENELRNN